MGGGESKSSDGLKKFKALKPTTAGEFQMGVNKKSITVGGSKKLFLLVGTCQPLGGKGEIRIKISPFGRKKGVALSCNVGKAMALALTCGFDSTPLSSSISFFPVTTLESNT